MGEEAKTETKFSRWVLEYGVARLVHEMRDRGHSLTSSAVYQWLRGTTEPQTSKQRDLVRISRDAITLEDIHDHIETMKAAAVAAQ